MSQTKCIWREIDVLRLQRGEFFTLVNMNKSAFMPLFRGHFYTSSHLLPPDSGDCHLPLLHPPLPLTPSTGHTQQHPTDSAGSRCLYLQFLALVVEFLPVMLQLSDLAVELGHHRVSLLLKLTVSGLFFLQTNLPHLDVFLL